MKRLNSARETILQDAKTLEVCYAILSPEVALSSIVIIREKAFLEMKKRCRDDHCSKK